MPLLRPRFVPCQRETDPKLMDIVALDEIVALWHPTKQPPLSMTLGGHFYPCT
jgi:hypothetical protein